MLCHQPHHSTSTNPTTRPLGLRVQPQSRTLGHSRLVNHRYPPDISPPGFSYHRHRCLLRLFPHLLWPIPTRIASHKRLLEAVPHVSPLVGLESHPARILVSRHDLMRHMHCGGGIRRRWRWRCAWGDWTCRMGKGGIGAVSAKQRGHSQRRSECFTTCGCNQDVQGGAENLSSAL